MALDRVRDAETQSQSNDSANPARTVQAGEVCADV
jgi:hypothetical protein